MTDTSQDASDFSFRTFDIYRRFVEVLQYKPDYLEDFKTGAPKKETCLGVIKRVFQYDQEEEDIKKYTQYFENYAKMMSGHAEKLPGNWNDAIVYTDRYIKVIHNYLRRKGISTKSELSSVEEIAKDIGEHIHGSPSTRQVDAIRYYLKYDLRNPKKRVISSSTSTKAKKKSNRSSKHSAKPKVVKDKAVEGMKIIYVHNENHQSSTEGESEQKAQSFQQINHEKETYNDSNNNNETLELSPQFERIETEIVDDLFETSYSSAQDYMMDMDYSDNSIAVKIEFDNEETVKLPESSPLKNYVAIENSSEAEVVEETTEIQQYFETHTDNSSSIEINERNISKSSDYNFYLKRKSSSPYDNNHYSLKKQLQSCRRIPNNTQQKKAYKRSNGSNSSDSEINVENDDGGKMPMKNSIFNLKSQVTDMSYDDAMKHLDLATTFCQLKNAISQEELLTMQQVRDKMYVKSLNERSSV